MIISNDLINKANLSFEIKCLKVLIKSYNTSLSLKKYTKDWEEKTFSSHLVSLMKQCEIAVKYDLIITKEEELEDEAIDNGLKSANEANPIDIRFHNIWQKLRFDYVIEAKNISNSRWQKSNLNNVNASQQQTEYITKGVDRFLSGHFKDKKGCMVGYIVNGNLSDILNKINDKFKNQSRVKENIYQVESKELNCTIYNSKHKERDLKHLFFIYSN